VTIIVYSMIIRLEIKKTYTLLKTILLVKIIHLKS